MYIDNRFHITVMTFTAHTIHTSLLPFRNMPPHVISSSDPKSRHINPPTYLHCATPSTTYIFFHELRRLQRNLNSRSRTNVATDWRSTMILRPQSQMNASRTMQYYKQRSNHNNPWSKYYDFFFLSRKSGVGYDIAFQIMLSPRKTRQTVY